MSRPLTILFSGMIAGDPRQGGATWAVLQYVLGLRRLGHNVYFVEPIDRRKVRPEGATLQNSANADYFREVVQRFGLAERSALLLSGERCGSFFCVTPWAPGLLWSFSTLPAFSALAEARAACSMSFFFDLGCDMTRLLHFR